MERDPRATELGSRRSSSCSHRDGRAFSGRAGLGRAPARFRRLSWTGAPHRGVGPVTCAECTCVAVHPDAVCVTAMHNEHRARGMQRREQPFGPEALVRNGSQRGEDDGERIWSAAGHDRNWRQSSPSWLPPGRGRGRPRSPLGPSTKHLLDEIRIGRDHGQTVRPSCFVAALDQVAKRRVG